MVGYPIVPLPHHPSLASVVAVCSQLGESSDSPLRTLGLVASCQPSGLEGSSSPPSTPSPTPPASQASKGPVHPPNPPPPHEGFRSRPASVGLGWGM